jgi:GTP cyclohydrolase I
MEMPTNGEALQLFTEGYEKLLQGLTKLGYDVDNDENFAGTAERAARGFSELVGNHTSAREEIAAMLEKTFPAKYKEMVISKNNVAFGVCPHHLLPVVYRVSVAYIPTEKVLGVSKMSRLAQLMASRPVLQEDLTHELCRIMHEELHSDGSAVYVEGLHLCMAARGVRAHESRVVTSAVRGVFLNGETRDEFMKLVTAPHPALL